MSTHDRHVPHVVADVEPGARAARGLEDRVGVLDGHRERLLAEHRHAGLERGDRDARVLVVGRQHHDGVEPHREQLVERFGDGCLGQRRARIGARALRGVADGDDARAAARAVRLGPE